MSKYKEVGIVYIDTTFHPERRVHMKLLLTSGGIQNDSQRRALIDLLGKPIADAHALCIPTAVYGMKEGPYHAYSFITGTGSTPMCELGFRSAFLS